MTNSRAKGCRGEREWRDMLRAAGWTEARRGQQFRGGPDSPDVVCGPAGTHAEVKVRETHNFWEHMEQAVAEAAPGSLPYVAAKRNRKDWLVVLRGSDFLQLMRAREDRWNAIVARHAALETSTAEGPFLTEGEL